MLFAKASFVESVLDRVEGGRVPIENLLDRANRCGSRVAGRDSAYSVQESGVGAFWMRGRKGETSHEGWTMNEA